MFGFRHTGYPPVWASDALARRDLCQFLRASLAVTTSALVAVCGDRAAVLGAVRVWFRPLHIHRPMPLLVGWGVALFIWFAECQDVCARVDSSEVRISWHHGWGSRSSAAGIC
ncbi:MAG: hypothetical protein IPF76_12875 [Sphingopyxis sp.]|nr:hypothetical protein [Sphingopyxis sp.]